MKLTPVTAAAGRVAVNDAAPIHSQVDPPVDARVGLDWGGPAVLVGIIVYAYPRVAVVVRAINRHEVQRRGLAIKEDCLPLGPWRGGSDGDRISIGDVGDIGPGHAAVR